MRLLQKIKEFLTDWARSSPEKEDLWSATYRGSKQDTPEWVGMMVSFMILRLFGLKGIPINRAATGKLTQTVAFTLDKKSTRDPFLSAMVGRRFRVHITATAEEIEKEPAE